jgi:methionyl-tRNA formyltransferase
MRIILFLNNWGGWHVARWLRERNEDIVGLVIQPESDERFARQIQDAMNMPADSIWRATELRKPETVAIFSDLKPDIGISGWFGYILKPELLRVFKQGCINLHTAYLPWNRGWYTNVWPILDGSPAGITIHFIDPGVDTGDLIAQRVIPVDPTDTGGSLHRKITCGMVDFFKETWPLIKEGKYTRTAQEHSKATVHRRGVLAALDCIDLDKEYTARELLNLLRARTYPPYPAAYFVENAQRVYVRVQFFTDNLEERIGQQSDCIDLNKHYEAKKLLEMLRRGNDGPQQTAYFIHEGQRIGVSSKQLGEQDIKPDENPSWMTME